MTDLFVWSSDVDGDGTIEVERYSSPMWLPNIDSPHGGGSARVGVFPTLDGGVLTLAQGRAGRADQRSPGQFMLTWDIVDPAFLPLAQEDAALNRLVSVRLDHRWRQLEVTSSGLADNKVAVSAGYLMHTDGDTYWLDADAVVTCGGSDTRVYATPAAGVVTVDSGASVPGGSVELATISIAGSRVTVATSPSGVANARTGYVTAFVTKSKPRSQTGLELTIQVS